MPLPTMALHGLRTPDASGRRAGFEQPEEALDPAAVAELSSKQISEMNRPELDRVVRVARTPAAQSRLEYLDRATLERLAHQARLCCRNRGH